MPPLPTSPFRLRMSRDGAVPSCEDRSVEAIRRKCLIDYSVAPTDYVTARQPARSRESAGSPSGGVMRTACGQAPGRARVHELARQLADEAVRLGIGRYELLAIIADHRRSPMTAGGRDG
jgi:hypothetical protein